MLEKRITTRLDMRKAAGLHRSPPRISHRNGKYFHIGNRKIINFSSNDYLGLGVSPELGKKAARNFERYGASSSSSRLVSGNYDIISEVEQEYARYFGYESALFFPSGYQANFALISTLFEKQDTIFFDKHIHASSVKGITASGARFFGYNHNSVPHLEKRMRNAKFKMRNDESDMNGVTAVISESLFSMDGDFLKVGELAKLKTRHDFFCIIDEAHSFGAVGDGGKGIARPVADIAVGTFGKSFGLFGAFVLLPSNIREYLLNFSSPLIYTTTLPQAHAATALDALEMVSKSDDLRSNLRHVSQYMKESLIREGFRVSGDAHILALEIGNEELASEMSAKLLELGIFAFAARFPTVPAGHAILRISMTALHTEEDVGFFIETMKKVRNAKCEMQNGK